MSSTLKNLIVIPGLLLIAGVGFYMYTQNQNAVSGRTTVDNAAEIETSAFLMKLNELDNIKLEAQIFTDDRFNSLVDLSKPIVPEQVGRDNPFNPVN